MNKKSIIAQAFQEVTHMVACGAADQCSTGH